MKWITRERVKVDRVACPWLIKKFVDPNAEFLFVQLRIAMPGRPVAVHFAGVAQKDGHLELAALAGEGLQIRIVLDVIEIAGLFGGPEQLRTAVGELQQLLYAA